MVNGFKKTKLLSVDQEISGFELYSNPLYNTITKIKALNRINVMKDRA